MTSAHSQPAGTHSASTHSASRVLRQLVLPVYLPVFAVNGAAAMLVPILPLYLRSIGLSYTALSVVLAAAGVGSMLSQVALGKVLERVSETRVMVAALITIAVASALTGVVTLAVGLVGLRLLWGTGTVGWSLSRQTFMTRTIAPDIRGRAMGVFGGTTRGAFLVGPILSGWTAEHYGFKPAFALTAAVALSGLLPLAVWQKRLRGERGDNVGTVLAAPTTSRSHASGFSAFRAHRRMLTLAGFGQICVLAVREGRYVVLPLIGISIGLEPAAIGLLVTAGSAADLVLFPVSGYLMDRFGRLAAIGPSFSFLGLSMFVLAGASTTTEVTIAAVLLGIGNGLGSGTMLTLSADLAPPESPAPFLAAMGTIRDAGKIVGPLIVGRLADTAGLSTSAVVLGIVAFVGVAVLVFGVGETKGIQHPTVA